MPDEPPTPAASTGPFDERPGGSTEPESSRPPAWTDDPDAVEPFVPPAFGRFRAHTFHKLGGMGRVWRAHDDELGRDVAFKEIRPWYADDDTARARFTFEAEVTGRLDHPAVIPVYGFGRDAAGNPFYAMRFVEGQSLQDAITDFYSSGGPTGADRALKLRRLLAHFVTVCRAVDYAHSRGVIHRDLKPLNIMIGHFGETMVVDWGIAKRVRGGAPAADAAAARPVVSRTGGTLPGKAFGSPPYWSPEQAAGRPHEHDERTDVYGLGAVLFAILTGGSPHPNGRHADEPPSARASCPWVDAGLDAIARRAMAHGRAARYPTAAELADTVEVWMADQPILAQRGAVQALERAAAEFPLDLMLAEQLARQRSNLGLMLAGMSRDADAVEHFRAAADAFAALAIERARPRFLADQANCLLALARSLAALEKSDDARAAEQAAADLYRGLIARNPTEYRANVIDIMQTWAGAPPAEPRTPAAEPDAGATRATAVPPPPTDEPDLYSADAVRPDELDCIDRPPTPADVADSGAPEARRTDPEIALPSEALGAVDGPSLGYIELPDVPPAGAPRGGSTADVGEIDWDAVSDGESRGTPRDASLSAILSDLTNELAGSPPPPDPDNGPEVSTDWLSDEDASAVALPAHTPASGTPYGADPGFSEWPTKAAPFADEPATRPGLLSRLWRKLVSLFRKSEPPVPPAPPAWPAADEPSDVFASLPSRPDTTDHPTLSRLPSPDGLPTPVPVGAPADPLGAAADDDPPTVATDGALPDAAPRDGYVLPDGYALLGELGRGGMGVTYLARDNALNRRVVIKTLQPDVTSPHVHNLFLNEVRITALLEHPNIARVYASGRRADGAPFMVMEYINGVTLLRMLDTHEPGWSADLLAPLAQVCDGLHYAHGRGVVHRDAKLSNVVVTLARRAVLLDWGVAKRVSAPTDGDGDADGGLEPVDVMTTAAGAVMGTPAYMSPEQARGEAGAVGPWTDVFTVGADLFHLVTGRPPTLAGESGRDVIARLIAGAVPRLREVRSDVPPRLDAICARAMAARPDDRYRSAAELAADIRAFLADGR